MFRDIQYKQKRGEETNKKQGAYIKYTNIYIPRIYVIRKSTDRRQGWITFDEHLVTTNLPYSLYHTYTGKNF